MEWKPWEMLEFNGKVSVGDSVSMLKWIHQ